MLSRNDLPPDAPDESGEDDEGTGCIFGVCFLLIALAGVVIGLRFLSRLIP